jgi:hypothetical protein
MTASVNFGSTTDTLRLLIKFEILMYDVTDKDTCGWMGAATHYPTLTLPHCIVKVTILWRFLKFRIGNDRMIVKKILETRGRRAGVLGASCARSDQRNICPKGASMTGIKADQCKLVKRKRGIFYVHTSGWNKNIRRISFHPTILLDLERRPLGAGARYETPQNPCCWRSVDKHTLAETVLWKKLV